MGRKKSFAGLSWQAALSGLSQGSKSGIGKIGELSLSHSPLSLEPPFCFIISIA